MPYVSTQKKRIVRWEEITSENEQNGSCNIKDPVETDGGTLIKYLNRIRKDLKKGIQEGLQHKEFKYQYDL